MRPDGFLSRVILAIDSHVSIDLSCSLGDLDTQSIARMLGRYAAIGVVHRNRGPRRLGGDHQPGISGKGVLNAKRQGNTDENAMFDFQAISPQITGLTDRPAGS